MKRTIETFFQGAVLATSAAFALNASADVTDAWQVTPVGPDFTVSHLAVCERAYRNAVLRSRGVGYWSATCGESAGTGSDHYSLASFAGVEPSSREETRCERAYRNAVLQARRISYMECED